MTTPTIITPNSLIQKRENLIAEIKKSWSIISLNNVFPNGTTNKFDLAVVYKQINDNEQELIKTKVAMQAINMGFKKLSDIPEGNSYFSIFLLSQVKERMVKLKMIPTKKEEGESVSFTRQFIDTEIKKLELAKIDIEKELVTFNTTQFEM